MSLVQRGIIPKDVDLTPAFERNTPAFTFQPCLMHQMPGKKKAAHIKPPPPLKYKRQRPDIQEDDGSGTFITAAQNMSDPYI